MAILVKVEKIKTLNDVVTYSFSNEIGKEGTFSIDRLTGSLQLISSLPNDSRKMYFTRAARKVMADWQRDGYLPEHTYWAS
ncbi:hypothetical protein VRB37_16545 [Erwinia billingiae]|uniref:hypothetical protein n=1 Tax=Erwinia billingiae TaxID=182337 RepID=UPI0030CE38C9